MLVWINYSEPLLTSMVVWLFESCGPVVRLVGTTTQGPSMASGCGTLLLMGEILLRSAHSFPSFGEQDSANQQQGTGELQGVVLTSL